MKQFLLETVRDKRLLITAGVLGFLFACFTCFGWQLEGKGNVSFSSFYTYGAILLLTLVFTPVLILLYKITDKIKMSPEEGKKSKPLLVYGISAGVIFIIWFIQLVGVYPGYFNYDATGQWEMYAMDQVTAHHPVLHTILLGVILDVVTGVTGAFNKGVFCFLVLQLFIIALCFAYVVTWLYRRRFSKWFLGAAIVWFTLFPTVVINVLSVTKDSLFSAFFIVFLVMTLELFTEPEEKLKSPLFCSGWILMFLLTGILRNNAIYVMILFVPVLLIRLRKHWKKMLLLCGIGGVLYVIYAGPVSSALTVQGVSTKEFLSVPTQQLMRVYQEKKDSLSQEEIQTYELLFDETAITYYNPKISDVVKGHFNMTEYENNQKECIAFYVEQGLEYPGVYVNSFLHNTYGFWYPMAKLALDIYGNEGYFVCHSNPPAVNNGAVKIIENYYLLFEDSFLVYGDAPTVLLFAPASFLWLFLFVAGNCFRKKKWNELWVLSPVFLLFCTYLLGPVALVRYVSFFYYMVPFEAALLSNFISDKKQK
ncbi:MAG: hypothetical protein IJ291_06390 [Lachnospiraceae bacterium]|nr:hypothetical protein [Lachnospiraceae bacterium]